MTQKRKQLQRAFIITVAGAATALAAGCNGGETISNPPQCESDDCVPQCPEVAPINGTACHAAMWCNYVAEDGCPRDFSCNAQGYWQEQPSSCNPPPAECPEAMPAIDAICEPQSGTTDIYPSHCAYEVEMPCGPAVAVVGCVADVGAASAPQWQDADAPSCNLLPEACHTYTDPAQCAADPSCQYLVPGCGDGELVEAGCYAALDCTLEGCGDWGTCVIDGNHDPCLDRSCDACGSSINVCVPNAM